MNKIEVCYLYALMYDFMYFRKHKFSRKSIIKVYFVWLDSKPEVIYFVAEYHLKNIVL